ncbi:Exportin-1 [Folsomia candida]|uniref:Exportin-1 n=1 Tax=Folsomia candida TaxID=158441 RepID=A0A226D4G4_FOLCA|nr:Exportin-1 [Folsomia candida]
MFSITFANSGVVEAEEIEEPGEELGDFVPAWVEEGVEDNDGEEEEILQFDPIDDNDEEPVANFDHIAWEGDHEYFFPEASEFEDPETFVRDVEINGTSTPYSILRKFMTDEVIGQIIHQTNLYALQRKIPQWKNVTVAEFWNFLALHVLTGVVQKPSLKDYWSTNVLIATHYFGEIMSRNRFMQILRGLHFVNMEDPDLDTTNRFHKLGTILPDIVNNFRRAVNPGEFLTLDEELMPFRGRLSFRQYNPKKRGRFGIESFLLMDAEKKYVLDILPYQGRSTPIFDQAWIAAYGFGGATDLTLLRKGYFHKHHRLVLDNYFQSPTLAKVLILKREWPKNWSTFIPDIVGASKTNESLCQNNKTILKLLSEEVFDFSSGQMVQAKVEKLKDTMHSEFSEIFNLCQFVMENTTSPQLILATLETLLRFLNWIPLEYVFETELINVLTGKFLAVPPFRNATLKCLTEIAPLTTPFTEYCPTKFLQLFSQTLSQLKVMIPLPINIRDAFSRGGDDEQQFIQNLALFLSTFLKKHESLVGRYAPDLLFKGLQYLALISELCWAIGSISGAMNDNDELPFILNVMEDLFVLSSQKKKVKDAKGVVRFKIAFMYLVSQNLQFLRAHPRFLIIFVKLLFDNMHLTQEGVQDMACDTLHRPFIEEILTRLPTIICDLTPGQVQTFYEAVGHMISGEEDNLVRDNFIERLMALPNTAWDSIMSQAAKNVEVLEEIDFVQQLGCILETNVRAAKSLGHVYVGQLGRIYLDMLDVYKVTSDNITSAIAATYGESVTKQPLIKGMRVVKKESLKLISTWIRRSENPELLLDHLIPALLNAVLLDYQVCSVPAAREPEVLTTMAAIVNKLEAAITPQVPKIFDAVFQCTLGMITKDFQEFPDHRVGFFEMVQAVTTHCFSAYLTIPPSQFKLVLDSIIWAVKHTMRTVSGIGLDILYTLLQKISVQPVEISRSFHERISGGVAGMVLTRMIDLLKREFPHLTDNQVKIKVQGMFSLNQDVTRFRDHLNDFLVQIKEITGDDESDLYLEEREATLQKIEAEKGPFYMAENGEWY